MHIETLPRRVFISPKQARGIAGISEREIRRREDFPKPIKVGSGPNGRIVYVEDEVLAWVAALIAKRDGLPPPSLVPQITEPAPEPEHAEPLNSGPQLISNSADQPKRRGRPKGSKNRPGHRAGRPKTGRVPSSAPAEPRSIAAAPAD